MFKMPNRTRLLSLLSIPLLVASVFFLQPTTTAHGHHQQAACTLIHTAAGNTQVFVCPRNTPPVPGARPIFTFSDQTQLYVIVGAQPTATRTQPPAATATRTQPPAATQPPASPTQGTGNIAPFPGAPLCPTHNNRAYHGLWDAARGCHYDHHHGDNPHAVDDLFGGDLYTRMGGEISYPWQTFSDAGLENDLKHAGYAWHVRRDIPCSGVPSPCITAFRTLVHQHASGRDATVRYHSYVFEARTSDGGYILYSGWADFGDLHVPEGTIIVNEPDNHDSNSCGGAGRHKQHSANGTPQIIWYGASQQEHGSCGPRGFITLSTSIHDVWDFTSPTNPAAYDDYVCYPAGNCTNNATSYRAHLISINMITRFGFIYDATGRANWTGYADRYGLLRNDGACTAPSVDCAPVVFRNLRRDYNYQTANSHTANLRHDHDIYFNGQTSGWSQPVP